MTTRMKTVKLSSIKPNPDNPRVMKDDQFWKLVDNIKRYPHFLEKRGIVHADGIILGGNMRYRAITEALKDETFRTAVGVTKCNEIPATWVQDASAWSNEDRQAFIILDNSPQGVSGEWDWDLLANQYEPDMLNEWGLEVPEDEGDTLSKETIDDDICQPNTFIKIVTDILSAYAEYFERKGSEKTQAFLMAEGKIIEILKSTEYFTG